MDVPAELRERDLIVKLIKKYGLKSSEFIDVGCGDGMNIEAFSKLGMRGIGIDFSKAAIDRARSKNFANITFINADAMVQGFSDKKLIFLLNVLEHIEDDTTFLEKLQGFLAEEGYIFVVVPAHSKAYSFADRNAGHYRRYNRKELFKKLERAGFSIVECLTVGFPVGNMYAWVFNKCCNIMYKDKGVVKVEKTLTSGIRGAEDYYPKVFQRISKVAFPLLTYLIRLDLPFQKTDLGNNYVILAKKSTMQNESTVQNESSMQNEPNVQSE